jgi:S1-C subfamily serine protease
MNDKPFCEWKLKGWIILLVLFATGVLGYSFWSALDTGRVRMSGYHFTLGGQGAAPPRGHQAAPLRNSPLPPPAAQMANPAAQMANPAAQLVAMTNTYPQYPQWQGGTSVNPNRLDAITMPTPMGGIKFIGGTQVRVQNAGSTPNFNWAADIIRPCVVEINAIRSSSPSRPVANPNGARFIDPFDGFPDKFIGQMALESVGSGLIVDPSGYVVTNHHVVAGASTIIITRFQHKEGHYSARTIASDPAKDLALLQILGDGPFPTATLADSSRVEVGDWVLTVGNPFGLGHTVTAGIISGKRDSLLIDGNNFKGLLQTDAPINKGSSGGPLVNMSGQVVGINTAIYAPTGVFNGTGFAIPSNRVGAFVARILDNNHLAVAMQRPVDPGTAAMQRPVNAGSVWLGIGVIDMTADLAAKLSYPHAGGIYVSSLVLDSPADEAEVTRGDIITAVAGQPMQDSASLQDVLARLSPGQTVSVTIWRGGKTETLRLTTRAGRRIGA